MSSEDPQSTCIAGKGWVQVKLEQLSNNACASKVDHTNVFLTVIFTHNWLHVFFFSLLFLSLLAWIDLKNKQNHIIHDMLGSLGLWLIWCYDCDDWPVVAALRGVAIQRGTRAARAGTLAAAFARHPSPLTATAAATLHGYTATP